jgi:hypothetical protein
MKHDEKCDLVKAPQALEYDKDIKPDRGWMHEHVGRDMFGAKQRCCNHSAHMQWQSTSKSCQDGKERPTHYRHMSPDSCKLACLVTLVFSFEANTRSKKRRRSLHVTMCRPRRTPKQYDSAREPEFLTFFVRPTLLKA